MIQAPIVDRNLDINLHPLEGGAIPIIRIVDGVQLDLSGVDLKFYIKDMTPISLVAHPTDVKGRLLVIGKTHTDKVPKNGSSFALVDNSGPVPIVRWHGIIKKTIW